MPEGFRAGHLSERRRPHEESVALTEWRSQAAGGREQTERLRKRTRQLALANALGTRLSAMTEPMAILEAAVDELQRAFGYCLCSAVELREDDFVECIAGRGRPFERMAEENWSQPREAGLIGRCLRLKRPVVSGNVFAESDYKPAPDTGDVLSELVVPVWAGDTLWGVINVEEQRPNAFDEEDVRLVSTVADQVGSALRSATLYEQLERAYLGTAEALAAALEAKDSYTADHSKAIVEQALAVGRRLGLNESDLRTLRYGAIFPRHRQDRDPRGDPRQTRRPHRRGAGHHRAPHRRGRAHPVLDRVPARRPAARSPRARALRRERLPRRARGR